MCDLYTCMDNVCARTGDDAWHQAVEVVKDQGLLCLAPGKHGSSLQEARAFCFLSWWWLLNAAPLGLQHESF